MGAFSSCSEQGLLFVAVRGLLIVVASLCCGARALGARAQQLWRTDLVAPRHVGPYRTRARTRVSALAGGFLTTVPPGKSVCFILKRKFIVLGILCMLNNLILVTILW